MPGDGESRGCIQEMCGMSKGGSAPAWAIEAAVGGRVAWVNRGPNRGGLANSAGVSPTAFPASISWGA